MVDPAKTVIVSKLWADVHQSEVKTLNQLRTMGRLRNLRFAEIAADLMVPGKSTIAYSVVYENDLCLAIDRKAVVDKLKKLKTFFKNHYLILISQTNSNRIFEFSEMIQDEIIIPILFFTNFWDACSIGLKMMAESFTEEKGKHREKARKMLKRSLTSAQKVQDIISLVDGATDEPGGPEMLQKVFGSLANLSMASAQDIRKHSPLSDAAAIRIEAYFRKINE
ncbi:hypothetical protein AAMO2058_000726100 [Amorphochlora amoebiformis]